MRASEGLSSERGWSMIEVQLVLVIMGILTSLAGPSFMNFMDEAAKVAAASNVRSALPAVDAFYMDNGTYFGMDIERGGQLGFGLRSYDPGVKILLDPAQEDGATYCIFSKVGAFTYFKRGPEGEITEDPTPATSPCA
ncbi:MAG TPA: type II secretion system protein [Gaiellaceae bacterium]|nr:type II secretion system protein [Gaiellaceae bacterium]